LFGTIDLPPIIKGNVHLFDILNYQRQSVSPQIAYQKHHSNPTVSCFAANFKRLALATKDTPQTLTGEINDIIFRLLASDLPRLGTVHARIKVGLRSSTKPRAFVQCVEVRTNLQGATKRKPDTPDY
jgi:hypothetical protein